MFSEIVNFDDETAIWIDKYAIAKTLSREEVVQLLVRFGMYSLNDEENLTKNPGADIHPKLQLALQASIENLVMLQELVLENNENDIALVRNKARKIISSSMDNFAKKIKNEEEAKAVDTLDA